MAMVCEVMCCRSSQDPNRTYHKFPSDSARCKEWLRILGRKSTDLKPNSVVCSRHFRFKDYYTGGKRLLPNAVPALKLSPRKNLITSKIRKSEPNSRPNKSPKIPRKSLLNIKLNKFNESRQQPLKKTLKSKIALNSLKSKQLVKLAPLTNIKSEKKRKDDSKTDPNKAVNKKHFPGNRTPRKPVFKPAERSPPSSRKLSLTQNKHRFLGKNSNKSSSKLKDGIILNRRAKNGRFIPSNKKNDSVFEKGKCPADLSNQSQKELLVPSKPKDSDCDVKSKNIVNSEKLSSCSFQSTCDNCVNDKSKLEQLSTKDKRCLETKELLQRTKRPTRKRKRLLSEDEDDSPKVQKITSNKVQVQKKKVLSGAYKKELKQSQTGKNLSGIEKTISEMQNKIEVLEKKAILDEMQIESFKKALITQRNKDLQILMDEKENELLLRMDLLYLDHDPQRICRLCLQLTDKNEELIPLFWPVKNQALLSMIKQTTSVEVEPDDGMPSSICGECLEEMKRADWLKRRTQKSNTLIRKFLAKKRGLMPNTTEISQAEVEVKPKSDNLPNEEEITDEFKIEDVFSLGNPPMVMFENITIKQEPESDEDTEPNHQLNTTYSIAVEKPFVSRKCVNCKRTFKNPQLLLVHSRYCTKRFQCSECDRCFLNAALFRRHKQRYTCYCAEDLRYCSECNISFRWKWQLVFHVLRHNTQDCPLCSDLVHSKEHFQHHMNEAHPNLSLINFFS